MLPFHEKRSRVKGGVRAATQDAVQIRTWWDKWPDASVGVATGRTSGFWALDVDGEQGAESLRALVREHGPLPLTLQAKTPTACICTFRCLWTPTFATARLRDSRLLESMSGDPGGT